MSSAEAQRKSSRPSEIEGDLIAFAWAPEVKVSREELVRSAQEHSPLPIMLIPAQLESAQEKQAVSVH